MAWTVRIVHSRRTFELPIRIEVVPRAFQEHGVFLVGVGIVVVRWALHPLLPTALEHL